MTTGLRRTLFRRSELVRILSETHPEIVDPKCDLGAQLGQWLELSDAMTLFSVLNAEDGGTTSSAPVSGNDLPAELLRLRGTISDAINNDGMFHDTAPSSLQTAPRIPFPMPTANASLGATASSTPDFTPFHRYYLAHQREMKVAIGTLRANARRALAASSGAGRKLAGLDATFEKSLAAREQTVLANIPILLARCFEQRYAEHLAASGDDAAESGGDPATWPRPGSWLEAFCNDAKRVLRAELELRLKPVAGLIAALTNVPSHATAPLRD
ncbi:MAG: DUF3348 domain-containing protein [Candidatus Accumulibacter sp.]|nr:DUF3348 domain-containing protein [Accumulibacter sp.]